MNNRHVSSWFWMALVVLCLTVPFLANKTTAKKAATQPQGGNASPTVKTADGLTVVTFVVAPGTIRVNLPDDMRAGDTISGTVICEPKGNTKEERGANQSELNKLGIKLIGQLEQEAEEVSCGDVAVPLKGLLFQDDKRATALSLVVALFVKLGNTLAQASIPVQTHPSGAIITPDPKITQPTHPSGAIITPDPKITQPTHPSGAIITPDPKITNPPFSFPPVGQTGRPIVVTGLFDGDSSNTELGVGTGEEDRDTMGRFDVIGESPRKAIFRAPSNVIGPVKLHLTEGNTRTTGNYRSVGVNLSAPKTSLLKGERTTLTVEVNGLAGIKNDLPLQLDATGVILMDGGNFQNLRIKPPEVNREGQYFATRAITGQQAGAFTVVATVVVSRFDVCIADDANRHSGILWNTFTGDYVFVNPFPPPRPGGQPPAGGTSSPSGNPPVPPGGTGLTGTGKPIMKGCIITLTHNAPDRRVFAKLDACTKTGEASVETTTPKSSATIIDKNVSDNSCGAK